MPHVIEGKSRYYRLQCPNAIATEDDNRLGNNYC